MDWSALAAAFGLVFVAELGDKTQLAVITQTCKYRRPWAVFWGASLALPVVLIAVLLCYAHMVFIGLLVGTALGGILQSRRFRDIAIIVTALLGSSCYFLQVKRLLQSCPWQHPTACLAMTRITRRPVFSIFTFATGQIVNCFSCHCSRQPATVKLQALMYRILTALR